VQMPTIELNLTQIIGVVSAVGLTVWRVSVAINNACDKIESKINEVQLKIAKIESITETVKQDHDEIVRMKVSNEANKHSLDQAHSKVRELKSDFDGFNSMISKLRTNEV